VKCATYGCQNEATHRVGTDSFYFEVCASCVDETRDSVQTDHHMHKPPWVSPDPGVKHTEISYDHGTRIERRYVNGELVEAYGVKGVAYPKTREDLVDLGVDPYWWDAFGHLEQVDPNPKKRRAAPGDTYPSRAAARDDSRPSDEDEAWRRNRGDR